MTGEMRREQILQMLKKQGFPMSGATLAKHFYPSRRRRLGMESVACDGMESRRRREWHHAPACISVACDGMESRRRREWHHASACIPVEDVNGITRQRVFPSA